MLKVIACAKVFHMNLKTYIQNNRGSAKALAESLKVAPAFISQMASGHRSVSSINAVAIEKATKGEVTRKDLRPTDWKLHWPELIGKSK